MGKVAAAISFTNVSFRYPEEKGFALGNININIPAKSFTLLLGPTGCGKTTLLTLARGFAKEYGGKFEGKIEVSGQDINKYTIGQLGQFIGLIFQNPATQLHQLRVIDEVASAPLYQGQPYEQAIEKSRRLVKQILGENFTNRSTTELSGGQQQKVALAATLSLDAQILLLDEPFSFLDSSSCEEIIKILVGLHKQGKTIVVATHSPAKIALFADLAILIDKGEVVLTGQPRDVFNHKRFDQILGSQIKSKTKNKPYQKQRPILSAEGIAFTYPTGHGIYDISLNVYQGEILGIIGPNGSGKSTLARLLIGLLKPKKGKVIFKGQDITRQPVWQRAGEIGYVTQDPLDMLFESSVFDEAAFGPKIRKSPDFEKQATEALELVGLLPFGQKHPDSLSGGQKNLLSIADILANDPEVLILDEPEFGLDPKTWGNIANHLLDLKSLGKTVIIITQDLGKVLPICDRSVIIKDGKIEKIL